MTGTGRSPALITISDGPSYDFGTLKVGNEIKVKFHLKAGPELLAQLTAAYEAAGR